MKKLFSFVCALVCAMSLSAKVFYLVPNDNWLQSNARFAVYVIAQNASDTWVDMTAVEGVTGTYQVTVNDEYTKLIFCRMNPETSENNWNEGVKWNQTGDLLKGDIKEQDCYTLTEGSWTEGTWSTYVRVEDVYTVAGVETIFGSDWSQTDTQNDMVKQDDGTHKWEKEKVLLSAGDYTYKVVLNHKWNLLTMDNQTLTIETSGEHNITIIYDPSTKKATATATLVKEEVVIPTIQVAGSFFALVDEKWDIKDLTPSEDNLTASIKVTMEAGDYEFKIVKDGSWLGNNGTMERSDCTGWNFYGDAGNAKLKADAKGDYTFTWTYETNALSVTFPAATATDLIGADSDSKAVKMVRDGQLLIVRDGVTYNMMGSVVK